MRFIRSYEKNEKKKERRNFVSDFFSGGLFIPLTVTVYIKDIFVYISLRNKFFFLFCYNVFLLIQLLSTFLENPCFFLFLFIYFFFFRERNTYIVLKYVTLNISLLTYSSVARILLDVRPNVLLSD